MDSDASAAGPDSASDSGPETPPKTERRPRQWAVPVLAMVVIVAVPWLAAALVPGDAVAGWAGDRVAERRRARHRGGDAEE